MYHLWKSILFGWKVYFSLKSILFSVYHLFAKSKLLPKSILPKSILFEPKSMLFEGWGSVHHLLRASSFLKSILLILKYKIWSTFWLVLQNSKLMFQLTDSNGILYKYSNKLSMYTQKISDFLNKFEWSYTDMKNLALSLCQKIDIWIYAIWMHADYWLPN